MSVPRRFDHDEALRLRREGWTYRAIGDRLGVSFQAIGRVCAPEEGRVYLPAEPLQAMIRQDVVRHGGMRALALRARLGGGLDSSERILRRILSQHRVELGTADTYCIHMGHELSELYPVLDEDAAA